MPKERNRTKLRVNFEINFFIVISLIVVVDKGNRYFNQNGCFPDELWRSHLREEPQTSNVTKRDAIPEEYRKILKIPDAV
jgi:hypothetical protein